MTGMPHAQSDRGEGRRFLPPALATVAILGFLAFVTIEIILPEVHDSVHDHNGATYTLGDWFSGWGEDVTGGKEDFQKAFSAFEAELRSKGFMEDTGYVPTEWGPHCTMVGDTLHLYLGTVGEDQVAVIACEHTSGPFVGVEVQISYDVDGFTWDVPDRVAAIRALGIDLDAWLQVYERDHPVFEKVDRGPSPLAEDYEASRRRND